jgi:hypothetical protein
MGMLLEFQLGIVVHLLGLPVFGFTLWLGLYLLARDLRKAGLRFAGLGLVSYAVGLAYTALSIGAPQPYHYLPVVLPSAFWMLAAAHLDPDSPQTTSRVDAAAAFAMIALSLLLGAVLPDSAARTVLSLLSFLFLARALMRLSRSLPRSLRTLQITAILFFSLGVGLLLFPLLGIPDWVIVLAISVDLVVLGYTVAVQDAYNEGTLILPDALRSLAGAGLAAFVLALQVALVMLFTGQSSPPFLLLLYVVVATAIALQTASLPLQAVIDRLIFSNRPRVQQERTLLRAVSEAVPQVDEAVNLMTMDDAEFARLTRRALSHYSDLGKLAANPLTRLPMIDHRLQGRSDHQLERANELKTLLREGIDCLKPAAGDAFQSGDEWRYYNALYYPYVVGLKPYSRRTLHDDELPPAQQDALEWFQTYVPERTLYNWQTAAAKLVAQHLREQARVHQAG